VRRATFAALALLLTVDRGWLHAELDMPAAAASASSRP
jgi:hypothetical protein